MTEHKPWLSLPDEDPPERGLAELMAAARAKAEVMASPPWWKRLADLLKRPPVLALATVVVLIGGVIIVHKQPAEMQGPAVAPPAAENVPAEPAGFGVAQPPPPADTTPPAHIETKAIGGKNEKAAETKAAPERVETGSVEVDLVPKGQLDKTSAGGGVAKGQAEEASVVDDVSTAPAQQGRDDTAKRQVNGEAAVKQPVPHVEITKKPAPGASLARCRSAAANKDCASARACAKQIETESPAFYKANVANDATIKPCL